MPYRSNRELPQAVRDNYTERCQKVFRDVWNNDYSKNKNESRAFSIANTAAKNCMANTTKDKREINKSDEVDTESHIEKAGERVSVPSFVSANARRGLKMYEDGYGGDGLVAATISAARDMVQGSISEEKLRKIGPWIARHIIDLDAPKNSNKNAPGYPGAGLVAMLLWGAGPDKAGARRTMDWANSKVEQLDKKK
jgi:cation transport regulator ChaB